MIRVAPLWLPPTAALHGYASRQFLLHGWLGPPLYDAKQLQVAVAHLWK